MLTKDDIAAMKRSNDCFARSNNGQHIIVVGLRHQDTYTVTEQRLFPEINGYSYTGNNGRYREIVVDHANMYDYELNRAVTEFSGFASLYDDDMVHTVANSIKAGDSLHFIWRRNNANASTNAANIVRDDFILAAYRDDRRIGAWLMAVSVGLDNSARMARLA